MNGFAPPPILTLHPNKFDWFIYHGTIWFLIYYLLIKMLSPGQFDGPPPAGGTELYCNVSPLEQPPPDAARLTGGCGGSDVTNNSNEVASTSPPSSARSVGLVNIALRPTSMYDPDQSLFDAAERTEDDIYENQVVQNNTDPTYDNEVSAPSLVSQESSILHTVHEGALHPTVTTEKLRSEGFAEADIVRAMEIVGDNEDMTRRILQSFVSRNWIMPRDLETHVMPRDLRHTTWDTACHATHVIPRDTRHAKHSIHLPCRRGVNFSNLFGLRGDIQFSGLWGVGRNVRAPRILRGSNQFGKFFSEWICFPLFQFQIWYPVDLKEKGNFVGGYKEY